MKRVAIVTPWAGEPEIELSVKSVNAQELPPDVELHHVIVRDGIGEVKRLRYTAHTDKQGNRHELSDFDVSVWPLAPLQRHFLAMPGDPNGKGCGGVPRALGSHYAVDRLRCHALGFLDADNWIRKHHVRTMLEIGAERPDCDALVAKRFFIHWKTGEPMPGLPDKSGQVISTSGTGLRQPFVDTNCIWLQGRGVLLGRDWGIVRRWQNNGGNYNPEAPIQAGEDVPFWRHVMNHLRNGIQDCPMAADATVAYRTIWMMSYPPDGKHRPPPVAKVINGTPPNEDVLRVRWRIVEANGKRGYEVWPDGDDEPPVTEGTEIVERAE